MSTQWEYEVIRYDQSELNEYGKGGWELVCVDRDHMYFKRPLGDLESIWSSMEMNINS